MRQKKKKKDQLYYLFLFLGLGGEGDERGSMSAVAVNMKNLCDNLERVDMYIFFLLIIVYIWFINLIIKSLKISFLFIYTFQFSLKVLIAVEATISFKVFLFCFVSNAFNKSQISEKTKDGCFGPERNTSFLFPSHTHVGHFIICCQDLNCRQVRLGQQKITAAARVGHGGRHIACH